MSYIEYMKFTALLVKIYEVKPQGLRITIANLGYSQCIDSFVAHTVPYN